MGHPQSQSKTCHVASQLSQAIWKGFDMVYIRSWQTREGENIYQKVHSATLAIAEQHEQLMLEIEKKTRLQSSPSEEMTLMTITLPRSAYWHHITRQNSVNELYSLQGNELNLTKVTRAQTFPSYISEQSHEHQHLLSPSSGYGSSYSSGLAQ